MTGLAVGLVLFAAFLHATWNLLAKRAGGGVVFVWLVCALAAVIYLPLAAWTIVADRPPLGRLEGTFILGSGVLHLAYFLMLTQGYRAGDLSLIYPLARGTGPALSAATAIAVFGERPTGLALVGAALVVGGVVALTGGRRGIRRSDTRTREAVTYGLLTGALIASYTLWDKWAVSSLLIPPLLVEWGSNASRAVFLLPAALRRWDEVRLHWRAHRMEILGVAVLSPLGYILVLTALVFAPVSYVAPAREVSILIATVMGARLLAEGDSRRRLAAAGAIAAGVVALAVG